MFKGVGRIMIKISQINSDVIDMLSRDDGSAFAEWFKNQSEVSSVKGLLAQEYEYPADYGEDRNTILWGVFKLNAYSCFSQLTKLCDNELDLDIYLRMYTNPIEKFNKGNFLSLIASKSSVEMEQWLNTSKDYWFGFFERKSEIKGLDRHSSILKGILWSMRGMYVPGTELLIALHKTGMLSVNDVVYVIGELSSNSLMNLGYISHPADDTMLRVEREELQRTFGAIKKSNEMVAL